MVGQLGDTFINGIGWIDTRTTPEQYRRRLAEREAGLAREAEKARMRDDLRRRIDAARPSGQGA